MARIGKNVTVEEVKELDRLGLIHRKLKRAPLKDTVTVPDGGYTIVRFYADNPGKLEFIPRFTVRREYLEFNLVNSTYKTHVLIKHDIKKKIEKKKKRLNYTHN